MKKTLLVLIALLAATPVPAQRFTEVVKADRRFTFVDENDAFPLADSDSAYTQGLRLRWDFAAWSKKEKPSGLERLFASVSLLCKVGGKRERDATFEETPEDSAARVNAWCGERRPTMGCLPQASERADRPCGLISFAIGQTEYTPANLISSSRDSTTRPYAGYLFATLGATVIGPHSAVTSELSIGVTGPWSLARETQSLAHWVWSAESAPEPMGWQHQLNNAVHVSLRNAYVKRLIGKCWGDSGCTGTLDERRKFDLNFTPEAIVGTLMNRASFGGGFNVGYGFPDLMSPYRISTTAPPIAAKSGGDSATPAPGSGGHLWGALSVTGEFRGVLNNSLLSGSYADRGPADWNSIKAIDTKHLVWEASVGLLAGWKRFVFSYNVVRRGPEYFTDNATLPDDSAHQFVVVTLGFGAPIR